MRTDQRQWDEDIIRDMCNEMDQGCILNTSINVDYDHDQLYWNKENSGHYPVRSAYRWLQAQKDLWRVEDDGGVWRRV